MEIVVFSQKKEKKREKLAAMEHELALLSTVQILSILIPYLVVMLGLVHVY